MDPVVIRLGLKRPYGFLAKSTLFGNVVGKATMEAFGAIPVYRVQDGSDTAGNNKTFELCQRRFRDGGAVVIFPEGVSHSDAKMRRLKTGAARIALQTVADHEDIGLTILPVGLFYEAKETFRSGVAIAVGEPIEVRAYLASYRAEGFEAASRLTEEIDEALGGLVLQAESAEVWNGLVAVARWTDEDAAGDVGRVQARARELSAAYSRMVHEAPDDAQAMVEQVQAFGHTLRAIGIADPWDADLERVSLRRVTWTALLVLAWFPFAVVGVVSAWVPYRAFDPLARRIAGKERDLISTVKGLLGLVFLPLVWGLEGLLIGWWLGWWWGLGALLFLPACGFAALRFGEFMDARREVLKAYWLRVTHKTLLEELKARRAELVGRVEAALQTYR